MICIVTANGTSGQREVHANLARQSRKKVGCANIREKARANFRHGKAIALAGDAVRVEHGQADAATHANSVNQRNHRFWMTFELPIEGVFDGRLAHGLVEIALGDVQYSRRSPPAEKALGLVLSMMLP